MEKRLEKNVRAIFEKLLQGDFLSYSSVDVENKKLFRICSENYDELYEYFILIGFVLEKGKNYFYFAKNDTEFSDKYFNKKMVDILELLELLSFMITFDNDFNVGSKLSINDLVMAVEKNLALASNLKSLKQHNKETIKESCESILKTFINAGFMELVDRYTESYKALESLDYIIKFSNELTIDTEII